MSKPKVSERSVHFSIDGEYLTYIARQRVLEDNPGHAYRIASSLGNDDGDDHEAGVADAAIGILNGTKKLVGNESGMKLVKEHAKVTKAYLKEVDYIYAGRIKIQDKWYRPIAYVSDMGRNDMRNDHGKPVDRVGSGFKTGYTNRAWHYCGHDEIVINSVSYPDPHYKGIQREVIFRACGERPHWQTPPLTAQIALEQYLVTGMRLEERSHSLLYGRDESKPTPLEDHGGKSDQFLDQRKREQAAIKSGDVSPMNQRVLAELDLANALDEDDRQEVQELRDDPMKGSNAKIIKRAYSQGLGVGVMAEMLDEYDPAALAAIKPTTTYEQDAERIREEYRLAREIKDDAARDEAYAQLDAEADASHQRRIDDLRTQILAQANGDLIDLSWPVTMNDDGSVRLSAGSAKVPRAPFMHWAFARLKMYEDQLPAWRPISPPGMKMMMDDQNHTDWIIGAGLDPEDRQLLYFPGPVNEAALTLASEMQDLFDRPAVHVLVDGPACSGIIVHGKPNTHVPDGSVVVLPNLHPRYLKATINAVAIITEAGGATAHLAQIGRDRNLPIVLIPGAKEKYQPGDEVMVNTSARTVTGL